MILTSIRLSRSTSASLSAAAALSLAVLFLAGCRASQPTDVDTAATEEVAPVSVLPEMSVPEDNPITPAKVELGKQLFFDTRLSNAGEYSCETCHIPEMGWTDGLQFSTTAAGNLNTRHSPTLYNVGYYTEWYWDGRAPTLEAQVLAAWRGQMGADPEMIAARIASIPGYAEQFQSAMASEVTPDAIVAALATFVRTILADGAPWDRYEQGDPTAVSAEAIAGFDVFSEAEKANCTLCHLPPLYTDGLYHNVGIGFDGDNPDMGRGGFLAQQNPPDPEAETLRGAFKTPTLRNIRLTAPYFHDGSASTLDEALDYMLGGGHANPYMDERLEPRQITLEERTALVAFLDSLTSDAGVFERPDLPPGP